MRTTEIRANKKLMSVLGMVARGRNVKTHNHEGVYYTKPYSKWDKYSLYEVYKNPSQTKVEIDEEIRRDMSDIEGLDIIDKWTYSGNCMSFSMSVAIQFDGKKYGLTFTRDNLHVIGYDHYQMAI